MEKKKEKVKVSVSVNSETKQLLDVMLKKVNLTINDLSDTYLSLWISQNQDLLSKEERKQFKQLLF